MVGVLQGRRIVAQPPHQQVGVRAQTRQVIPATGLDAGLSDPLVGALDELTARHIVGGKRSGNAEYRVHCPLAGGIDLLRDDGMITRISRCDVGTGGGLVVARSLNH